MNKQTNKPLYLLVEVMYFWMKSEMHPYKLMQVILKNLLVGDEEEKFSSHVKMIKDEIHKKCLSDEEIAKRQLLCYVVLHITELVRSTQLIRK